MNRIIKRPAIRPSKRIAARAIVKPLHIAGFGGGGGPSGAFASPIGWGGNGGPDRLGELLAEQRRTNELLDALVKREQDKDVIERIRSAANSSVVPDDHEDRSRVAIDSMFGRSG